MTRIHPSHHRLAVATLALAALATFGLPSIAQAQGAPADAGASCQQWVPAVCQERRVQVWCEPVYRTVCDDVWVAPVYQSECHRVWHEPVCRIVTERIWAPDRYEDRDVVQEDCCGHSIIIREHVLVCPGHFESCVHTVQVSAGYYTEEEVQVCVREGHYDHISRQELVTPGHYDEHVERVEVSAGHWVSGNVD